MSTTTGLPFAAAQVRLNMFSETTAEVKVVLYSIEHWQYDGVASGVKMLSFLGKKIYRKSSTMLLAKCTELTQRKPIQEAYKLGAELDEIAQLCEDLDLLKEPVSDMCLWSALMNMISTLRIQAWLNGPLVWPTQRCQEEHTHSGRELMECMRAVVFELQHDKSYTELMKPKQTAPREVLPMANHDGRH